MASVRIDKWLWAARFFKTRALAVRACKLGRIQANGQPVKAAREVRIGDKLGVTNDGGDFQVEVLLLSEVRGPASVAQTLYRETEASRELRLKVAAEGKLGDRRDVPQSFRYLKAFPSVGFFLGGPGFPTWAKKRGTSRLFPDLSP
jgi:ribosome-associated heat shock protein Hsp15